MRRFHVYDATFGELLNGLTLFCRPTIRVKEKIVNFRAERLNVVVTRKLTEFVDGI